MFTLSQAQQSRESFQLHLLPNNLVETRIFSHLRIPDRMWHWLVQPSFQVTRCTCLLYSIACWLWSLSGCQWKVKTQMKIHSRMDLQSNTSTTDRPKLIVWFKNIFANQHVRSKWLELIISLGASTYTLPLVRHSMAYGWKDTIVHIVIVCC